MKTKLRTVMAVFGLSLLTTMSAVQAQDGVGYGGAKVELQPMMVPTRNSSGEVRYEVLTLRIVLDAGPRERPACFSIPYVHEKLLTYMYHANLTPADLIGQRQEVLAKNLLKVAIDATDKNFYSAVEIVDEGAQAMKQLDPNARALDPKSQTLSNQCK
ncbi:MAG: hypothetical protein KDE14_07790 [Rhodobacteraceae bacterium]|nr:hypothetical protein [Paracoccaceae bacterium]